MRLRTALGTMALLAAAVAWPAPEALASYPGAEGLIAVEMGGNLFTVPPGGSTATQLTTDGDSNRPRWSPSGSRLAFDRGGDIWTVAADGSSPHRVTSGSAWDTAPTWSPDGRRIAFVRSGQGLAVGALWVTPVAGGAATLLARPDEGCAAEDPVWSPSGGRLAFRQLRLGPEECAVLGVEMLQLSTGKRRLVAPDTGDETYAYPRDPDFSPDGLALLVTARDALGGGCSNNAYRIGLHSGAVTQLTYYDGCEGSAQLNYAAYSPNGTRVTAVTSYPFGETSAFRLLATSFGSIDFALQDPDWQPLPASSR